MMLTQLFIFVIYSYMNIQCVVSQQISPCPYIFSYENQKQGSWIGAISYSSPNPISNIEIWIELDKIAKSLTSNIGAVTTQDNVKFLITDPSFLREAGNSDLQLKIKVTYEKSAPQIATIKIDHEQVCPEFKSAISLSDRSQVANISSEKKVPIIEHCGTTITPQALILNSQPTIEGHYPWHVALYEFKNNSIQTFYFCGGSLITIKHILTAAHCVSEKSAEKLTAFLGIHDLSIFNEHFQARSIIRIDIHPKFTISTLFDDIAILELLAPVQITEYVRTICLWRGDPDKHLVGHTGIVVGWGNNIYQKSNKKLQEASMPVIDSDDCKRSDNPFYSYFMYKKNFCAGFANGTAPCLGDSGGGLVFQYNDNSQRYWYLRGIVSLSKTGKYQCDDESYTLFTHVDKFITWIEETIGNVTDTVFLS